MFTDANQPAPFSLSLDDLHKWAADLRQMCHAFIISRCYGDTRTLKVPIRFPIAEGYSLLTGVDSATAQYCVSTFHLADDSERIVASDYGMYAYTDIPLAAIMELAERANAQFIDCQADLMRYLPKEGPEIKEGDLVWVTENMFKEGTSYHAGVVDVCGHAIKVQVTMRNQGRTDIGMIYSTTRGYVTLP